MEEVSLSERPKVPMSLMNSEANVRKIHYCCGFEGFNLEIALSAEEMRRVGTRCCSSWPKYNAEINYNLDEHVHGPNTNT